MTTRVTRGVVALGVLAVACTALKEGPDPRPAGDAAVPPDEPPVVDVPAAVDVPAVVDAPRAEVPVVPEDVAQGPDVPVPACHGHAVACGGTCVDLLGDLMNCGGCGQRCQMGERCHGGHCG